MNAVHQKIAGIGYRAGASEASLEAALSAAGGVDGITALASIEGKAEGAPMIALAARLGLPVISVSEAALAAQETLTQSDRIRRMHGTGSVAEAAALSACGPGARLLAPRATSHDRMATAAIAVSGDHP